MSGSHLVWITDYGDENIEVKRVTKIRKRDLFLIIICSVSVNLYLHASLTTI